MVFSYLPLSFSQKSTFWDYVTWLSFGKLEGCVNSQPTRAAIIGVVWELHSFESPTNRCVEFFSTMYDFSITTILYGDFDCYCSLNQLLFQKNDNLIKMCFLCGVILWKKGWKWLQSTNTLHLFSTSECLFLT